MRKKKLLTQARILPGDRKHTIASIIRVNHAGEYGAKRIYEGQIAATKCYDTKEQLQHMAKQEQEHLSFFEGQMLSRKVKPTIFLPIWHHLGYVLGFVTAKLGKKTAMACTISIEDTIEKHYQNQIEFLESHDPKEQILLEKITIFREEEMEHMHIADEQNGKEAPLFYIFDKLIKLGSKVAIAVSRKI